MVEEERQFRQIYLFTLDSTQEIYIAKKQVSKRTHIRFSLKVKMVEILMDLNWK